jgi:drug/metabolite transporter (DMT)-like permease
MGNKVSAVVLLVVVMVIWGSAYAVTKASVAEIPPILFAVLRNFVASILLVAVAQMRGGITNLPRPVPWATIALMGLTGISLYYIGFNVSLFYTSASQGALIESFIPIVTALLAAVLLKESLSAKRLLGIGISTAGVLLIIILTTPNSNARNPLLGNGLMLGTVVVWSIYTILAKRLAETDQLVVTAYSTAFGTLLLIPAAIYESSGKSFPAISASGWLSVLYLGAVASAGAYWLYNRSLKYLEASQTAIFMNLLPVIGVAVAVLFLGESLTVWQLTGGALVLLGVWVSLQSRNPSSSKSVSNSVVNKSYRETAD